MKGFNDAFNAAAGGGVALTALKNERRTELKVVVRDLAGYVQLSCNSSLSTLLSSGFPIQKPERQPVGPVTAPENVTLTLGGHTGELDARANPVSSVSIYNWRLMAAGAPTVVVQTAQTTGATKTFGSLTPGVTYMAEVNAVGTAGPSDWSQSASQMVL